MGRICEFCEYITVACLWRTPAAQCLSTKLWKSCDEIGLCGDPLSVFLHRFITVRNFVCCSCIFEVREWVAPLARASDIDVMF
jgi:hypothetical protein